MTEELWYFVGNILNKYKAGITTPVYTFSKNLPGRLLFFTRNGNILCSLEGCGEVYLSQNNGQSFTTVLSFSSPNHQSSIYTHQSQSWAMNWAVEQIGNTILLGEYHLDNNNRANIYISYNEGQSWSKLFTFPKHRHIHQIKKDTYSLNIYITTGDKNKDVYRFDLNSRKPTTFYENRNLMSIGFHKNYIAFGSDKEKQNYIFLLHRDGNTRQDNLTPPRDLMVYDFALIGDTLISTNRLTENLPTIKDNYHCLWVVEHNAAIANIESFYFSNVINNVCYTGRTQTTIKITGGT